MKISVPRPTSLRPLSAAHRRWFWTLMALAAVVIAIGWSVTIREVIRGISQIQSSVEEGVDRAAEGMEEAQLNPQAQVQEAKDVLGAFKAGYEAEKQRQEQTSTTSELYGQEESTN